MQERLEQLQDENEELRQQLAALQDDLDAASRQRPGTSGMSSALRQQVATLQVGIAGSAAAAVNALTGPQALQVLYAQHPHCRASHLFTVQWGCIMPHMRMQIAFDHAPNRRASACMKNATRKLHSCSQPPDDSGPPQAGSEAASDTVADKFA